MPSEQFIQNVLVILLVSAIALCLKQPLALLALTLLSYLPNKAEGEEESKDIGFHANVD